MRTVATPEGVKIGPEYFNKAVLTQVLGSWNCDFDELVLHGFVCYGVKAGEKAAVNGSIKSGLQTLTARMGELIETRHDYEATKEAYRLSQLKRENATVLEDSGEHMTLEKSGNLWRRKWHLNTGEHVRGHTHHFDHLSLLWTGSVSLIVDGEATTYTAPAEIFVPKDKVHRVIALEDHTRWWCVFACRDEMGEVDIFGDSEDLSCTQ